MMNLSLINLLFIFVLFLICCNQPVNIPITEITVDKSVNINKKFIEAEEKLIKKFIEEENLSLNKTGSGIYYLIEGSGRGKHPEMGEMVSFTFNIYLLNRMLIYSSDAMGVYQFKVDKDDVPSGLNQIIKLLKVGEKAKFILPSHLAYGVQGDGDKIPVRSPLYYEVKLIDIK